MKFIYTFFIYIIFSYCLTAQLAPNFTVTDSKGNQLELYADYLNQDKTVVLKLFFVECPPCTAIAPLFEDLYQEWGAGANDVEFIELSTKPWSSNNNAGVLAYQNMNDLNFIGVGNTGKSIEAADPYVAGDFGPYYGTPTFVIIAPDKTVAYNPFGGSSNSARIAAIDLAIAATGATKPIGPEPQTTFNIDLDYASSSNNTVDSIFLQNGDGSNKILLDNIGNQFSLVLPDPVLYPGITDPYLFMIKHELGSKELNIEDIIKLRKKAMLIKDFDNPLSLIAGDLNIDKKYNIRDLIILTKLAVRVFNDLPNGTPLYRYINDQCPNNDKTCLNGIPLVLSPDSTVDVVVDIFKMGDISGLE